MKQPSFIDPIEVQREYVQAVERGYGFARQGNWANYLFKLDQIEPSVLKSMPEASFHQPVVAYIWSFKGCTMASVTEHNERLITPLHAAQLTDWTRRTPRE